MKNQKDLRKERRGGFYWKGNVPYVSVTEILKVIDKPSLRYWYGREVYLAMVKDPTLNEKEALSIPYEKGKTAMNRGTTIHSIVEAFKNTRELPKNIPEQFKGYAVAFQKWMNDNNIRIYEQEKTVFSDRHGYAGTTDLVVEKNGNGLWVCDVKTGKDIYLEAHLQLSAYKHALQENKVNVTRAGIILLKENGNYKFEEVDDCFEVFLATKKIWEFLNREMCEKVGFKNTLDK